MALQTFANGESGLSVRTKINGNFTTLAGATGASEVGYQNAGASSVARTAEDKINDNVVTPADFGAAGAAIGGSPADETAELSAFFTYLNANPGVVGRMPERVYGISSALPSITNSGVKIFGSGLSGVHDVGPIFSCTTIQWLGGVSAATMLSIAPPVDGVSGQYLDGIALHGVAFNCASNLAGGVSIKSVRSSLFALGVANATANGVLLGVVPAADLGEGQDLQTNDFFLTLRQVEGSGASGVALRLQGSATANVSLNRFRYVDVRFANASAVIEENADNNIWEEFRANCSGSATYAVEWLGGASEPVSCRGETFYKFSGNKGAVGRGTGTYTYPATNNVILALDVDNATPAPVYETGASGIYLDSRGFFGGSKGGVLGIQGVFGQTAGDVVNARSSLASTTSLLLRNGSADHLRLETGSAGWSISVDGSGDLRMLRLSGTGVFDVGGDLKYNGATVSLGASDSGGTGFRVLRIPN